MRLNNDTYRSLNESINRVQNPQAALDEAMEYTAALEEVLLSLCEELNIDPQTLVEGVLDEGVLARVGKKLQRAGQTVSAKVKKAYALADGQRLGDSTLTPRDRLKELKWERREKARAAKRKELTKQKRMGKTNKTQ